MKNLKRIPDYMITEIFIIAMSLAFLIKCITTAAGGNYLYADGSNFIYSILQKGSVVTFIPGRRGSFYLMQLPVLLCLKAGIKDINVLCMMYGIGSAMWLGGFILLAMILCKKYNAKQYITILAVLYSLINVFSGFFTAIESVTAVGMYCFLLIYYLISCKGTDWMYRMIALALLAILPVANEYFVGYSTVLLIVLVVRLIQEGKKIYTSEWILHMFVNGCAIYYSWQAATEGAPTTSLLKSIETLSEKKYYWILLAFLIVSMLLALLYGAIQNSLVKYISIFFSILCIIWFAQTIYLFPDKIASASFSMRFMNLIIPSATGIFCFLLWWFDIDFRYILSGMAFMFLVFNCMYDIQASNHYHNYLIRINELAQERQGFFEVDETDLDRTFCWSWAIPIESFMIQCLMGEQTIDSNMIYQFDMQDWEAFDSDNIEAYGDMSVYGIQISKEAFQL